MRFVDLGVALVVILVALVGLIGSAWTLLLWMAKRREQFREDILRDQYFNRARRRRP